MGIIAMPFLILGPLVLLIVLGAILYSSLKARNSTSNQEMQVLQNDISQIKTDIQDIKEQIADFIIKTY